jgi:hypothetical protein
MKRGQTNTVFCFLASFAILLGFMLLPENPFVPENQTPNADHATETASLPLVPVAGQDAGWLLPTLLRTDLEETGRWDYWFTCREAGTLPEAPLPTACFLNTPHEKTFKMLTASLDAIPGHGKDSHLGWSSSTYFRFFTEWLLFGLGQKGSESPPADPLGCKGASDRLLEVFDLPLLLHHPYDYMGDLLAECAYGRHNSFYPTPHPICEFMVRMLMLEGDNRAKTVCDPCTGTGRLLLHASNYSMRLFGMDIDQLMCQIALVNGYFFAPWLVRPLPFLDGGYDDPETSVCISDSITATAPPHIAIRLEDTEPDTENQWKFEPIKLRRKKTWDDDQEVRQGKLF